VGFWNRGIRRMYACRRLHSGACKRVNSAQEDAVATLMLVFLSLISVVLRQTAGVIWLSLAAQHDRCVVSTWSSPSPHFLPVSVCAVLVDVDCCVQRTSSLIGRLAQVQLHLV